MKRIGGIRYCIYDWQGKIKWYYDIGIHVYFVDPMFEEEFIGKIDKEINLV